MKQFPQLIQSNLKQISNTRDKPVVLFLIMQTLDKKKLILI